MRMFEQVLVTDINFSILKVNDPSAPCIISIDGTPSICLPPCHDFILIASQFYSFCFPDDTNSEIHRVASIFGGTNVVQIRNITLKCAERRRH